MAKKKIDGVIEAVHYGPDGNVKWVRAYLRRGPTYTDRVKLDRQTLMDYLKTGKNFHAGQRVLLNASTFELTKLVRIVPNGGREILSTSESASARDNLEDVPLI